MRHHYCQTHDFSLMQSMSTLSWKFTALLWGGVENFLDLNGRVNADVIHFIGFFVPPLFWLHNSASALETPTFDNLGKWVPVLMMGVMMQMESLQNVQPDVTHTVWSVVFLWRIKYFNTVIYKSLQSIFVLFAEQQFSGKVISLLKSFGEVVMHLLGSTF